MDDAIQDMTVELTGDKNQEKEIAKKYNDEADKKVHSPKRSEEISKTFSGGKSDSEKIEEAYKAKSMARCETIISTTVI